MSAGWCAIMITKRDDGEMAKRLFDDMANHHAINQ
jgi:hypothetical protein